MLTAEQEVAVAATKLELFLNVGLTALVLDYDAETFCVLGFISSDIGN